MTSLATAFVEVRGDTSRLGPDISRGAGSAASAAGTAAGKSFSTRFGSALKVGALLAGAFAVTKGAKFLGDSIREASNLNESLNAVNVTFGKNAGGIKKLGKDAAEAVGLSNSQFNGLAVQFSAFAGVIAGKGGDVVGTIDDLSKRGADFASVMNIDVNKAMELFQSGLAGETEPLRKFGIDMSAAAVQAFAYANGIGKAGKPLTEQQKVQARYALLMKQTAKTQGDFANTSDQLANKQRILRAEFDNLKAAIGARLLPVATKLVTWASDFVKGMQDGTGAGGTFADIMGTIGAALEQVGGFIRDVVVPYVGQLKGKFVEAMGGSEGFKKTMSDLKPVFDLLMPVLGAFFKYILFALPILIKWWKLLASVLGVAATVAMWVWTNGYQPMIAFILAGVGRMVAGVTGAFNAIRGVVARVVGWLGSWVPGVFARVAAVVRGAVNIIRAVVTAAFNAAKAVVTAAVNIIRAVVSRAFAVVRAVVSAASGAVRAAMSAISGALRAAGAAAGAFASTVRAKIGQAIGFIKSIPGKARAALGNVGGILVNAGRSLIQGLIQGIGDKIGEAVQKVKDGLNKIKGMLPGSPIKSGPLRSWNDTGRTGPGGQLVGRLISGIDSQGPALEASVSRLASRISVPRLAVDASVGASGTRAGSGGGVVQNIYETTDARATAAESARRLAWAGVS